ncbi:glycoside hydrolase family 128 protein [Ceratobasidium sp. AG-Ba]|nr:glycoside hydrolase family 128 protein [Ceratobasidium sp. AG-Ba]
MAAMSRLMPMMALSTFAIFLLALLATPTNALSNTEPHVHARGHDSIAKRKRNALKRAKRCRPKTSSLGAATSTSAAPSDTPAPTTHKASSHPPTTQAPSATPTTSKAPATTSAPPPPPSTGGGGGGLNSNKKLLLAWPNGPNDIGKWKGKNLWGIYTWSPYDANAASIGAEFAPMVWGAKQKSTFQQKINGADYTLCMGFNEPNQEGQSDMSVADGVNLWRQVMTPAGKQGCKLVSPATTSAPSGIQWVKDFQKACPDCQMDFIALHWYDVSLDAFKAYTEFYNTFKKPIIISEFACQNFNNGPQCTKDQTWALHTGIAKFAAENDWIALIAPFGAMRDMQGVNPFNQMMDNNGNPTDLGQFWLNGSWN